MGDGEPMDARRITPLCVRLLTAGHPPNQQASPTCWILLDLHAYVADRENATSAWGTMSNGKAIRVTFCTAPPPLVSYICVWSPDAEIGLEPTVEAAESDLILICVFLRDSRDKDDCFVYKAAGSRGPSLRLLQDPEPCWPERYNYTLLAHRDIGYPHAAAEGDDHYCIAALNGFRRSGPGDFKLWLFNSMDGEWSTMPVSVGDIFCHITSKTIALGGGGLLGFVDPWRGIIVCDVLGRKPARYLQLPTPLIRLDKFRDEPLLERDIAFVEGRLTVVELTRPAVQQGSICNSRSRQISSWSRAVSDQWEEDWRMDYVIQSPDISVDNTGSVDHSLLNLPDGNDRQPSLGKLYIDHRTLSLSDSRIVYIMGQVNPRDKKALVLAIDMSISKLQGVAMFDAERMIGFTYTQSRISKYFNAAPGDPSFPLFTST
ncbi:uncharacterized protein LOC120642450 [Panicum virgatum]|uniref:uncharacterized protein LOC120642450 n=1 Tax=Panicum virgatum TaxID=38727 RepID=UPI0019D6A919|nr:uncharacterized protein LOC120642450 [Panicum virgatum]